jgi:hypothetical protein
MAVEVDDGAVSLTPKSLCSAVKVMAMGLRGDVNFRLESHEASSRVTKEISAFLVPKEILAALCGEPVENSPKGKAATLFYGGLKDKVLLRDNNGTSRSLTTYAVDLGYLDAFKRFGQKKKVNRDFLCVQKQLK